MQSSFQATEQAEAPAAETASAKAGKLHLLSLLTFTPTGNPLLELTSGQRSLLFDYLLRSLHNQRKEQSERVSALTKKIVLPASLTAAAVSARTLSQRGRAAAASEVQKAEEAKKEERQKIALKTVKWEGAKTGEGGGAGEAAAGAAGMKFASLLYRKGEGEKGGEPGGLGPSFSSAFGQKSGTVSAAMGKLLPVIDDYSRGDAAREKRVVDDLRSRMRSQGYKTDDLMASLLMVIEDDVWSGEEGGLDTAKPHGGATRLASLVPKKLRTSARDSAEVRLASVREMLRYYFLAHPEDYQAALAAALGITADQEEDVAFLQERLAYLLASIGAFALAQKLLAELKKKKKMDTKECLMRLGYRYDKKGRRLIVGKRTCGKPAEARGIIGVLLESMRGKSAF